MRNLLMLLVAIAAVAAAACVLRVLDEDLRICVESLAYRQDETAIVRDEFDKIEGVRSYAAIKTLSQQGLFYAIAVEAGVNSRFIFYRSGVGIKTAVIDESQVRAAIDSLREQVERTPYLREDGAFGGQSCDFIRVFDEARAVSGEYANVPFKQPGIGSAVQQFYGLVDASVFALDEPIQLVIPPEYDDAEIDEYLNRLSKDRFPELSR